MSIKEIVQSLQQLTTNYCGSEAVFILTCKQFLVGQCLVHKKAKAGMSTKCELDLFG